MGSNPPSETETIGADEAPLKLRIAIIHPDLGIGGAERLVVDAALGLQARGHTVEIITSHHDPNHAFEETVDGSLRVSQVPSFIPRSIFGAFHIYLAILRQFHLVCVLLASIYIIRVRQHYDVYVLDQLSACGPLLRWVTGRRLLFYCHFPDKLLAGGKEAVVDDTGKGSLGPLKSAYRAPADWIEEYSTGLSDIILANSKFTVDMFKRSFSSIEKVPEVVYPGINVDAYETSLPDPSMPEAAAIHSDRPTLVSFNRFERKKNVALAIEAYSALLRSLNQSDKTNGLEALRLVVGGGYDPRVQDNIDTLVFLADLCNELGLSFDLISNGTIPASMPKPIQKAAAPNVTFLLNFTTTQRQYLLKGPHTLCLLYTPGNEHFGIGPVEGMISGLPVLACQSGGPTESLVDFANRSPEPNPDKPTAKPKYVKGTAWLRPPNATEWTRALLEIVRLPRAERDALAVRAKARAREKFSMKQMCVGFEFALYRAVAMGQVRDFPLSWGDAQFGLLGIVLAIWVSSIQKFSWNDVVLGKPAKFGVILTIFFIIFRVFFLKIRGK